MSYPSGPGRYGPPPPNQMPQRHARYRAPAPMRNLPFVLDVLIGMLGVLTFFPGPR
jgi:hypothetical protein